jgi:predicted Rossmann-fold nucleotide-binding protein
MSIDTVTVYCASSRRSDPAYRGCGTLEELFEAITWKRLGLFTAPIVLVNTRGFFDPCVALLERAVAEHFMDDRHRAMWSVVPDPDAVLPAIRSAAEWTPAARSFALL